MNTVALADLLPEPALTRIFALVAHGRRRKADFMTVLECYRGELRDKGVIADYLGYVLEAQFATAIIEGTRKGYCAHCNVNRVLPELDNGLCQMCDADLAFHEGRTS